MHRKSRHTNRFSGQWVRTISPLEIPQKDNLITSKTLGSSIHLEMNTRRKGASVGSVLSGAPWSGRNHALTWLLRPRKPFKPPKSPSFQKPPLMLVTLPKAFWKTTSKSNSQPTNQLPQTSETQPPRHPKYKFLPLRKKFGQRFISLKRPEEVDQLRREARKGRKWLFVGKGKDRR